MAKAEYIHFLIVSTQITWMQVLLLCKESFQVVLHLWPNLHKNIFLKHKVLPVRLTHYTSLRVGSYLSEYALPYYTSSIIQVYYWHSVVSMESIQYVQIDIHFNLLFEYDHCRIQTAQLEYILHNSLCFYSFPY